MRIEELMTGGPESLPTHAPLIEAAQLMRERDIGVVPICEGDRLVGVLTDRDIAVRAVAEGCDVDETTVEDVMTAEPATIGPDGDVVEAVRLMQERQIRRLPVVDGRRRLIGVVSLGDIATRCHDDRLVAEALTRVSEPTHA